MIQRSRAERASRIKRVFVYEYLSGGGAGVGSNTETALATVTATGTGDSPGGAADAELLQMGLAMRNAMVADLLKLSDCAVTVASGSCGGSASGSGPAAVIDGAPCVSPRAHESPTAFVARQAKRHDLTWVVAPETDGLLTQLCWRIPRARWLGCNAEAVELASAKQATLAQLVAHGVSTPLMFDGAPEVARWVVKPDDGAGAVATRVHEKHDAALTDLTLRSAAGRSATLEPWVDGEALSLSLLCRADGAELLSINRQQIEIDADGLLSFAGVAVNAIARSDPRGPALRKLAAQVARAMPGLRGFVGIDLVWHATRGPVVIEVNPRVTCAYVGLSQSLDRNVAADVVAAHLVEHASAMRLEVVHARH